VKPEEKEYVDQQIAWVRDLKRTENYWLEKYLESELHSEKERMSAHAQSMDVFKQQTDEKIGKLEKEVSKAVSRPEMRSILIAVVTILLTFLGLLVAIFIRK